jgi:hypothetical protein
MVTTSSSKIDEQHANGVALVLADSGTIGCGPFRIGFGGELPNNEGSV